MDCHRRPRRNLALAGLCLTFLAACSTPAPPPPTPSLAPAIGLSTNVIALAASYQAYGDKVLGLPSAFTDGAEVARDLRTSSSYKVGDLTAGSIGYGAVVALQDRQFVTALSAYAQDPARRSALVANIYKNPAYATAIPGTSHAASLVVAALDGKGQAILANGAEIKQSAYTIQHQAWSKDLVNARPQRLADIKALADSTPAASVEHLSSLLKAANGSMPDPVSPAAYVADIAGPYTPVVTKAIAVAALGILGEVADGRDSQTVSLMSDAGTDHCLTMAKLNLYQCLAVAGPHYEDVFCMGQHAIKDTGQCLILAAGAPIPPDVLAERAKQAAIARDAAMKIPTLAEAAAAKASSGARRKKGR